MRKLRGADVVPQVDEYQSDQMRNEAEREERHWPVLSA
jgi:hypothetical protein